MHDDTQVTRVGEEDCRGADVVGVHDEIRPCASAQSTSPAASPQAAGVTWAQMVRTRNQLMIPAGAIRARIAFRRLAAKSRCFTSIYLNTR